MKKFLLPLAALALAACIPAPAARAPAAQAQAAPALADFSRWIDQRYVAPFVAGDIPRWLEVFTDDVVGLHNSMPPLRGKAEIEGFGSFVAANLRIEDMRVSLSDVQVNGDWAYTWGTYHSRLILRATNEPLPGHSENGKVFFLWKRQGDGSWKVAVDMGNAMPGTPAQ